MRQDAVNLLSLFVGLAQAEHKNKQLRDGNIGAIFPVDDARDLALGLRFIPGEVTVARRKGHSIQFCHDHCPNPCCWYWDMEDGPRIYYWERGNYEALAQHNGIEKVPMETGGPGCEDYPEAGPCPLCGNPNTKGGRPAAGGKGKIRG